LNYPDDGGKMFLRNVGTIKKIYTASYPKRLESSKADLKEKPEFFSTNEGNYKVRISGSRRLIPKNVIAVRSNKPSEAQ
jgi:hypothetical protein